MVASAQGVNFNQMTFLVLQWRSQKMNEQFFVNKNYQYLINYSWWYDLNEKQLLQNKMRNISTW